jgi:hypothetical protein
MHTAIKQVCKTKNCILYIGDLKMWPTIVKNEIVNCRRDLWKWTYYNEPFKKEALERDFPPLPLNYEGHCPHTVGIESVDKFHCCICGYTITRR